MYVGVTCFVVLVRTVVSSDGIESLTLIIGPTSGGIEPPVERANPTRDGVESPVGSGRLSGRFESDWFGVELPRDGIESHEEDRRELMHRVSGRVEPPPL